MSTKITAPSIPALLLGLLLAGSGHAASSPQGEVLGKEGTVDFAPARAEWTNAVVGQPLFVADRLRTKALSRATVQLAELGRFRVNELTTLEILPPRSGTSKATLDSRQAAVAEAEQISGEHDVGHVLVAIEIVDD